MPGPFPGMDPYLENPRYWRGFHNRFIGFIEAALNADLPPGFAANSEERVYVLPPQRSVYPDVMVLQSSEEEKATSVKSNVAVMEISAAHGVVTAYPDEIKEAFVEIHSTDNWEQVITIIEVLSPANKAAFSEGRKEYLQKQDAILRSDTHLLEIDLLRDGAHTVAAPLERLQERGQWDYLISLHRSTRRYDYEYWFSALRQPLPPVRVPLTEGIPDVTLDLQAAFDRAYDTGPYKRSMNYREAPPRPLNGEDAAWADTLLREKGLRPG